MSDLIRPQTVRIQAVYIADCMMPRSHRQSSLTIMSESCAITLESTTEMGTTLRSSDECLGTARYEVVGCFRCVKRYGGVSLNDAVGEASRRAFTIANRSLMNVDLARSSGRASTIQRHQRLLPCSISSAPRSGRRYFDAIGSFSARSRVSSPNTKPPASVG